jgi:hypothetical protein
MADLYLKKLESERKALWATCRLKGLAKDAPERQRVAEIDRLVGEHHEIPGTPRNSGGTILISAPAASLPRTAPTPPST